MKTMTAALLLLCGVQDVDSPEFQRWSAVKVGSWAKYKSEIDTNGVKTVLPIEITYTLVEADDKKVVVEELTLNTLVPKDSPKQEKARKRSYTAKSRKKDIPEKEGDEELEAGGKKLACHWTEIRTNSGSVKSWISAEVPGGVVRLEVGTPGLNGLQRLNLLSWEKK
jgi:hypothetical protein